MYTVLKEDITINGWMGGELDGSIDGQTDRWMDKGYFEGLEIITPFMYYTVHL